MEINKDQANFFDYIYPSISRRLDELEKKDNAKMHMLLEIRLERDELKKMVNQYKKKIQRIEQFLIEHGLIKLLTKEK